MMRSLKQFRTFKPFRDKSAFVAGMTAKRVVYHHSIPKHKPSQNVAQLAWVTPSWSRSGWPHRACSSLQYTCGFSMPTQRTPWKMVVSQNATRRRSASATASSDATAPSWGCWGLKKKLGHDFGSRVLALRIMYWWFAQFSWSTGSKVGKIRFSTLQVCNATGKGTHEEKRTSQTLTQLGYDVTQKHTTKLVDSEQTPL